MPARIRFGPSGPAETAYSIFDSALAQPTNLWVDASTLVSDAEQIGSMLAPFRTVRQALAYIATQAGTAWSIRLGFGDYSGEGTLSLLPNKRYVFDGIFRSSVLMRLPPMLWTVSGAGTNYVQFRNVEAGLVTLVDGSPAAVTTVLVYENAACQGVNTFNPTPGGGVVTPAGASNVTAILRLAS